MSSRNDPFNFTYLKCEDCGSTSDLYMNRFRDNVKCLECINKLLKKAEEKILLTMIEVEIEE